MKQLKVLEFSEKYLLLSGMIPHRDITTTGHIFRFILNVVVTFVTTVLWLPAIIFMYLNPDDIKNILNAVIQLCAGMNGTGTYIGVLFNIKPVMKLYDELQRIIDEGEVII